MCVCVWCVFIKLHITAQSAPVILIIICHSYLSSQGGIDDTSYYYETSDQTRQRGHTLSTDDAWVVIPFILDVGLVDVPSGVTQETGHRGLLHLPCAMLALIVFEIKIQPSFNCSPLAGHFLLLLFLVRKSGRVTAPRFELISQRQKVSRLPTEPPGRPALGHNIYSGRSGIRLGIHQRYAPVV